jgi:hypothetical protein
MTITVKKTKGIGKSLLLSNCNRGEERGRARKDDG